MKHPLLKVAFIICSILILYAATMHGAQPAMAEQGGFPTTKIEPALLAAMTVNPSGQFAVVVQTEMPGLGRKTDLKGLPSLKDVRDSKGNADLKQFNIQRAKWIAERIQAVGGKRLNRLTIVGGVSATLSADAIVKLSRDPFVSYIQLDKKMKALGSPGELSLHSQIVRAADVWAQGIYGLGVSVAILDSGVAAVNDLRLPVSRIVASVDFTGGNVPGDPGGHGTHVAGIVAGNGTDSAQARVGVAPGANIVDVRVIDSNGSANLSSVIGGIQWVIQNRRTYNIRVMNLSLGATMSTSYRDDLLAAAVEVAWSNGIVVVAAAGNSGPTTGTIVTPGSDPFVITVGALDDAGTFSTTDDRIAFFSSRGPTLDAFHKPDLVAPGRKIVSLRAPGSYLDKSLPDRITDNNYFRLSGTSMSSPVVAGTAALMLQKNPWLRPNQIKYILMQTAHPVASTTSADSTGAGLVDAYLAVNSILIGRANYGLTPADSLAKAVYPILKGMPLDGMWRNPYYKGIDWANITWDNITWDRTTWENIAWENITWDNITWTNITWDNITWDSATWDTSGGTGSSESAKWDSSKRLD